MSALPNCPICGESNTYPDGSMIVCADCGHELSGSVELEGGGSDERVVKDSNGNVLANGDSVIVIKDLKVKGSSIVVKKGTKVKSIRIVEGDHDIDCKVDGVSLSLKSEFLKKA